MQRDDTRDIQQPEPAPRKPYHHPTLEDLGTVTELTQAVAGKPTDGGPQGFEGSQI